MVGHPLIVIVEPPQAKSLHAPKFCTPLFVFEALYEGQLKEACVGS
jgi:hypothetical protein